MFNDLSGAQGNSRGRGLPIFREIKPAQESAVANRGPPTVFRIPLISFYSFFLFFFVLKLTRGSVYGGVYSTRFAEVSR